MSKIVRVALTASGSSANNIPGSDASLSKETNQVDDSIFGQNFASFQPTLIDWSIQSNAYFKGIAGYLATIKKMGTSTSMTSESMSPVDGTNKIFEIDAGSKSLWDKDSAISFVDTGVSGTIADSDIVSIDYLFGRVTFLTAHAEGSGEEVQVTGNYFPLTALGSAQSFSLRQTADTIDTTNLSTAQANGGFRTYSYAALHASLELTEFFDITAGFFDTLSARSEIIIDIVPSGTAASAASPLSTIGSSRARGYFKAVSQNEEGSFGGDEMETIAFELSVPTTAKLARPFGWIHGADSTLSQALQDILTVWETKAEIVAEYLPEGTTGSGTGAETGNAIVTEASLAGSVEGINEFSVTLQGTGALAAE